MGTSAATRTDLRTDTTTKRAAEQLFGELGLDMSTTLNTFLERSIREQALSICLATSHIPNATIMQTTEHAEAIRKGEISEDEVVSDNVDDTVKLLDTLV